MPVSRASATKLRKSQLPYTTLPNETILLIDNPDALAIWVYLQTRPSGWTVRPTELRKRFKLGRDRSARAMRDLKALGLMTHTEIRGEDGRLAGSVLHVHYEPVVEATGSGEAPPEPNDAEGGHDTPGRQAATKAPSAPGPEGNSTAPSPAEAKASAKDEDDGPDVEDTAAPGQASLLALMDASDPEQRLKEAFETFYNAGLPKRARKKAEKAFARAAKQQSDPVPFAEMLAANIQARLIAGELGFAQLHPSTYLNQERWLDEIDEAGALTSVHGCPDEALYDLFSEVMRKQGLAHKAPKQGFDMFRGTRGHQEMLARWDQLFGTTNPKGRLRYDDEASGLAFWRYAFELVAQKQNFQQSDVTITTFFYRDVFHRAIEGSLRQYGAAR